MVKASTKTPGTFTLGKIEGDVSFDPDEFDKVCQAKGSRVLWSRALECPFHLNNETEQANPNCELCGGSGYFYVKPSDRVRMEIYECAPKFEDTATAAATQVLLFSVTKDPQVYEKFGEWVFGTLRVSPFSFNRLDYRDRLELVDTTTTFRQLLKVPENLTIPYSPLDHSKPRERVRYKAVKILEAYVVDGKVATPVELTIDATTHALNFSGSTPPDPGTLVTVSYTYHPILIVLDHVYAWRDLMGHVKDPSPLGTNAVFPHHAMARLDFLPIL